MNQYYIPRILLATLSTIPYLFLVYVKNFKFQKTGINFFLDIQDTVNCFNEPYFHGDLANLNNWK